MPDAINRNKSGHVQALETLIIPIGRSAVNTEVDTGYDLPVTGLIVDAYVWVKAAEVTGGTKTLTLGLLSSESGGDADGIAIAVGVATTGIKRLSLANGAVTKGALLSETTSAGPAPRPHDCAAVTAKSVSRTLGSNDFAELDAYLVCLYSPIPKI